MSTYQNPYSLWHTYGDPVPPEPDEDEDADV